MPEIIEVQGGLVSLVSREVTSTIPLKDWLDKIERRSPVKTPTLPTGMRDMYWDESDATNQKLAVLIELEPATRTIDYRGDNYSIMMPWTRFFFTAHTTGATTRRGRPEWVLGNHQVFWSKNKYIDAATADMVAALLPNVYRDGRICFGSTGADASQPIGQRLDQTVNEFYASRFNDDLTIRWPTGIRSFGGWQTKTSRDATAWMEWADWDPAQSIHTMHSFEGLCSSAAFNREERFAPMVANDGIPPVPLGATFGRLGEWFDQELSPRQKDQLRVLIADRYRTNPGLFVTPVAETDPEDE